MPGEIGYQAFGMITLKNTLGQEAPSGRDPSTNVLNVDGLNPTAIAHGRQDGTSTRIT